MHPTLLPKHRGRAPLPWAIIYGLKKTGVTMFHIDLEADNGDIIGQEEVPIDIKDDAMSLYKKTLDAHVSLMRRYFPLLAQKKAPRIKQDESRASFWPKRVPGDGIVDWNTGATHLYDWVRALSDPYPGAFTFYGDKKIILWKAVVAEANNSGGVPGTILGVDSGGLLVLTGEGALRLTCIEPEGEKRLTGTQIRESSLFDKGGILG